MPSFAKKQAKLGQPQFNMVAGESWASPPDSHVFGNNILNSISLKGTKSTADGAYRSGHSKR